MYSDGYNFLKGVKDRDGDKVTEALNEPGNTLINSRDISTGETALHIVVSRRDSLWISFLLSRGADPNIADRKGITPLMLACNLGFVEGVEALAKGGAQVDMADSTGETPLIAAVHQRNIPLVRILLANGANPDRTDNSGRTARDYAQLMGKSSGVMAEIEKADADRKAGGNKGSYGPVF
ncbi:MAG: ankyrin repeat domain-containing protein [Sphingomonadales bacterium]|nr:ankyrin repeat domain-containing protein [Sphingomonadales bacterium]MBD3774130.1 ankyrin repeat domain-containing protein [Paracoccaceae bacterium]